MIQRSQRLIAPTGFCVALLFVLSVAGALVAPATAGPGPATVTATVPGPPPPPSAMAGTPVTVLAIPSIGVAAKVGPLGLTEQGELAVPEDFAEAGWWRGGSTGGEPGPTVLVGHVDDRDGPAVFFRLDELEAGAEVRVSRADGDQATYVVDRLATVPKDRFPTDEVYGATDGPTLRLITCTGPFDRRRGSYTENLIVFARFVR